MHVEWIEWIGTVLQGVGGLALAYFVAKKLFHLYKTEPEEFQEDLAFIRREINRWHILALLGLTAFSPRVLHYEMPIFEMPMIFLALFGVLMGWKGLVKAFGLLGAVCVCSPFFIIFCSIVFLHLAR